MRRNLVVLVGVVLVGLIISLSNSLAHAREITEKEIVSMFVLNNAQLQALRHQVEASQSNLSRSWSALYPTIDANASAMETKSSLTMLNFPGIPRTRKTYTGTLDLRQPLYTGGKVSSGLSIARLSVSRAEQELLTAKQGSLVSTLAVAYRLGNLIELQEVLLDSQKFQQNYLSITRGKVSRGTGRNYEVSQAEADYFSYEPRLQAARRQLQNIRTELAVGLQLPQQTDSADDLVFRLQSPKPVDVPGLEKLLEVANQNRPEIRLAEIRKESASQQKWYDFSDDLPSLALVGSAGYQSPDQEEFFHSRSETYSVGLVLKIPLFSGLSSIHKRQAASQNISAAEKLLTEQRRIVQIEVTQEYENMKTARETYESSSRWTKQAKQALEQALQSYRVGTITSTQILQIQNSRERSSLGYIEALTEYHLSLLRMRRALGIDIEKAYSGEKVAL